MSRQTSMKRPFTGGMVTDVPGHDLGPSLSTYAQDGFSPQGVFKQRQGWAYDGTTADVADNLVSVHRAQYVLADTSRTITVDDDGELRIHNPSSSGTLQIDLGSGQYLPRCMYRDELILCAQDGTSPLVRYAGANLTGSILSTSAGTGHSYTQDEATASGANSWASTPQVGAFFRGKPTTARWQFDHWMKIVAAGTASQAIALEGMIASTSHALLTNSADYSILRSTGYTFPCVSIYNAGTVTYDNGTGQITGYGTRWSTGITLDAQDALFLYPTGADTQVFTFGVTDDDTLGATGGINSSVTAKSSYNINRRCNFKDAATHKGSLWGTGNAYYPSRVYVSPPDWNPTYPPGFILPFDPTENLTSPNANDFQLDFIDVPSSYDGDDNIAILPSPNPLLVLKRKAVYGIYGSYPNFSVDMLADGIGCIDIRSAHSYDEGQFWAGEGGIYWYAGGQVRDLTAGRINREWRALTRDFDYGTSDYCTLGVANGHLIVHITTGGGVTQRTYLCDLRDGSWQSRISNFTPRYMFTSRIPGEKEKLLAVSNARQGRVIDFAPALDGSGTAKDDAGDAPRLQAYTPEGIGGDISGDTRMLDLAVHANVYDAGAAGSTSMTVSVVSQDALTDDASTATLADIDSDTTDRLDRHYFRRVDRRGRRHQVRLEVDTLGTDSNATKVEVHQIDATFRESRKRT